MLSRSTLMVLVVAVGGGLAAAALGIRHPTVAAHAQDQIVRQPLQKSEFPGDTYATHIIQVTVAAGGAVGRHTHPGIEMGYVIEGTGVLSVDGMPDQMLKPGDSYSIPAGAVHSARTTSATPIRLVATFVVEKAKPLATPAPK